MAQDMLDTMVVAANAYQRARRDAQQRVADRAWEQYEAARRAEAATARQRLEEAAAAKRLQTQLDAEAGLQESQQRAQAERDRLNRAADMDVAQAKAAADAQAAKDRADQDEADRVVKMLGGGLLDDAAWEQLQGIYPEGSGVRRLLEMQRQVQRGAYEAWARGMYGPNALVTATNATGDIPPARVKLPYQFSDAEHRELAALIYGGMSPAEAEKVMADRALKAAAQAGLAQYRQDTIAQRVADRKQRDTQWRTPSANAILTNNRLVTTRAAKPLKWTVSAVQAEVGKLSPEAQWRGPQAIAAGLVRDMDVPREVVANWLRTSVEPPAGWIRGTADDMKQRPAWYRQRGYSLDRRGALRKWRDDCNTALRSLYGEGDRATSGGGKQTAGGMATAVP